MNHSFSQRVKAEALKRSGFRCERCWSSRNLEFHHIPVYQGGNPDLENCIVLCPRCREIAPEDPLLLKMFIKFASTKEMIKHYGVNTEAEAVEAWCNENNISVTETLRKLNIKSHRNSIKSALKKKALKGEICGFNAPFGYEFSDGTLKVVEKEAEIVKYIYRQYRSGLTLKEIAESLNSKGIETKKNNKWSIWAVRRILKNPIYAGFVKWSDIVNRGKHPAIIGVREFNDVQAKMQKKTIRKPLHRIFINDGGPSLSKKTEHQMEKNPIFTQKTQS